jgi:hypothetical protein
VMKSEALFLAYEHPIIIVTRFYAFICYRYHVYYQSFNDTLSLRDPSVVVHYLPGNNDIGYVIDDFSVDISCL